MCEVQFYYLDFENESDLKDKERRALRVGAAEFCLGSGVFWGWEQIMWRPEIIIECLLRFSFLLKKFLCIWVFCIYVPYAFLVPA